MESTLTEPVGIESSATIPDERWKAVQAAVRKYLAAWQVGDAEWAADCSADLVRRAQARVAQQAELDPAEAALEEADEFLCTWLEQITASGEPVSGEQRGLSVEQRVALLLGSPARRICQFNDSTQLTASYRQGVMQLEKARVPHRPPETRAFTMQTSLSRLPSIQLIAGWFLLIALLFLAFFLTH